MDTKLISQDLATFATPLLAVFAVDAAEPKAEKPSLSLLTADSAVSSAAAAVLASGEFKAAVGDTVVIHAPAGLKAERLLIIGLGKKKSLSFDELRKGGGTAVRAAKPRGLREVAIAFPTLETIPVASAARVIAEGIELSDIDYDTYKSDRKDLSVAIATIVIPAADAEIEAGLNEGTIVGVSQNFARSLINEPGNVLTPTVLGQRAAAMCAEVGLKCEVYSTEKLHELKMGAFWAVSQGSVEPPALIVMTYEPEAAQAEGAPVIGLVGKGITFDTGGISIKPADGMEKMKYDMAGAGAMIGAMRAIALLKPAVKVISVICSAENMPDGKAFKPGDVVTAMSGKTIEIVNTDAEGRLVLADGLHYAKTLGCTHLINAATLTGAVAIALGKLNVGLFSNDDATVEKFTGGLAVSGEKYWRLPCTDDYADQIKSPIADIQNTGITRYGGSITAAMFLKEFVGETPWIHLDIAAMAWNDETKPWLAKGPSGIAVRSITEWVRSYAV
ncbi:leucyl aminopeptidase [Granulicella aggregans]|uniref:Probable cytosol aminopeptidase n=1 Tax=Granulicella aggregans TaxID=474949 RepID=A0A7W7ZHC6_9BACT|nr:leucyl aminopeptidase [Granulicella aggregans]MBB5059862.1 leucyl aminopeptidase [Granulicella aggregans]